MNTSTKTPKEHQAAYAIRSAQESLAAARETLERALRELETYQNRLDEAQHLNAKADVMNWALNALVCNITPNLRLDRIAASQAELTKAAAMQ